MTQRRPNTIFPSWLLWVIGPVTVLAAAVIVLAVVLGIQAGQRQIEIQRRQQVGIALQRATDYRTEGNLEAALAEYQRVLMLDPGNAAAVAGIESLLQMAGGGQGEAGSTLAGTAPVTSTNGTAAPASPDQPPQEAAWTAAQDAYTHGRWQDAIDILLRLQAEDPAFQPERVQEMLFNAYVNLAAEKDQAGLLEEALALVDKALALRPTASELRAARTQAAQYLDMLSYYGVDWGRTVQMLEELYQRDPSYRDVAERLVTARYAYGESLADDGAWCLAAEEYTAAIGLEVRPGSIARRDELQALCENPPTAATVDPGEGTAAPGQATQAAETSPAAIATDAPVTGSTSAAPAGGSLSGRLLYSAVDAVTGQTHIYLQPLGSDGPPTILVSDGQQPALRPDGQRLVYRNLRDDMRGLTGYDPATGLSLRFTKFAEDSLPSWNREGNRLAFASNREGDRRWRIYVMWADVDAEATSMGFGESPDWSPAGDRIVFRGCDETGNRCGLWTMTGTGADRKPLTTVPADTRPVWAPDGSFVAFMSDGRDGNFDIYRVDASGGQVTRLTTEAAVDVLPAVSPDGRWVAFLSNRNGAWAIWAVPSTGGDARLLAQIEGNIDNWHEQGIQWVR
ncbi:PD40 domain-containing protein [Litorilinea aerophila]|uniref:Tetratricopeptide repeat protein n=1 Tax=Litorilinea aerophila TaxID=1204385 RepID=A0A540VDQ4_9CHLR|nr:PD40 domain-containing protein [Litorilinea aerophila]MCC9077408.1 PD40 domain-containing protein [Litorilinea aerophila]